MNIKTNEVSKLAKDAFGKYMYAIGVQLSIAFLNLFLSVR